MAQKVHVITTSDISGEEGADTVRLSIDGVTYEVDLTASERSDLDEALAPILAVARIVAKERGAKPRNTIAGSVGRTDQAAIRAWANENGHSVSTRGRIPVFVMEHYDEAMSKSQGAAPAAKKTRKAAATKPVGGEPVT